MGNLERLIRHGLSAYVTGKSPLPGKVIMLAGRATKFHPFKNMCMVVGGRNANMKHPDRFVYYRKVKK